MKRDPDALMIAPDGIQLMTYTKATQQLGNIASTLYNQNGIGEHTLHGRSQGCNCPQTGFHLKLSRGDMQGDTI